MTAKHIRVLLLCSHPVQYASPMWRRLAQRPELEVVVAYCSLLGAAPHVDPGFGVKMSWDVPLLDGYPWQELKNLSRSGSGEDLWGLVNPGVWRLVRAGGFDAIAIFTGYRCLTFWMTIAAAKVSGIPVLFGTDATSLGSRDGKKWKIGVKKRILPSIFRLADIAIATSNATRTFLRSLGVPELRIALLPFVVDNDWWLQQAEKVNREAVRINLGIPQGAPVALFCAKLQPWKRPQDALRAFVSANVPGAYLIFAGDGPLRQQLEAEAESVGVAGQVLFLGFVNQTSLADVYCASDILVLPSEYDACPVVTCEAMLCGCPVLLSANITGRFDLIKNGETGFIYPCGDVPALASLLKQTLGNPEMLIRLASAARRRIAQFSPKLYVESLIGAVQRARDLRNSARKSLRSQRNDPGAELSR